MAAHNELGQWGEDLAEEYLRSKGYVIIDRDWHSGHFGEPEEAIDFRKRLSLQQTINHYVKAHRIQKEIRFDIIAITGTPATRPTIRHIQSVALL